jgi:elongation factor P
MLGHTDLKKGTLIELDGSPYQVVEYSHAAMGRGGAVVQTKLKNLITGSVLQKSFRTSDKVAPAQIDRAEMQYLYREGDNALFMNTTTYDQESVPFSVLGDQMQYLQEGGTVTILSYNGKIVGLDMPNSVYLKVTETGLGAKGDTATAALKPAEVETGQTIQVPMFINTGDVIKVDTRTGQYLERQK